MTAFVVAAIVAVFAGGAGTPEATSPPGDATHGQPRTKSGQDKPAVADEIAAREREAISRLETIGTEVLWGDESAPEDFSLNDPEYGVLRGIGRQFLPPIKVSGFAVYAGKPEVGDDAVSDILHIRKVRGLILSDSKVTDAGLAKLAGHPCIRSLDVSQTKVTDQGVRALSKLRSLERLSVAQTATTGAGIAALRDLPNLEVIEAREAKVSTLKLQGGFPSLYSLRIAECPLTDVDIRGLPRLGGLTVAGPSGEDAPVTARVRLEDLPSLRKTFIDVRGGPGDKPQIILKALPRLESLVIYGFYRDEDAIGLPTLPRLRSLSLGWSSLSGKGLASFARFSDLEELNIHFGHPPLVARDFEFLRKLKKLRVLHVSADVKGGIPQIEDLGEVRELQLRFWQSGAAETLPRAAKLKKLTKLEVLQDDYFSDEAIGSVATMTWLKELTLGRPLLFPQFDRLRKALPNTKLSVR